MHDHECLFTEKVYHMLHFFQLPRTKGKWSPALYLEQKSIKAKQKPLTFLLNKRMNADSKE